MPGTALLLVWRTTSASVLRMLVSAVLTVLILFPAGRLVFPALRDLPTMLPRKHVNHAYLESMLLLGKKNFAQLVSLLRVTCPRQPARRLVNTVGLANTRPQPPTRANPVWLQRFPSVEKTRALPVLTTPTLMLTGHLYANIVRPGEFPTSPIQVASLVVLAVSVI